MNTHQVRIHHDLTITVYTREAEAPLSGWQFGREWTSRPGQVMWASGEYKTEKLALRAAQRRSSQTPGMTSGR